MNKFAEKICKLKQEQAYQLAKMKEWLKSKSASKLKTGGFEAKLKGLQDKIAGKKYTFKGVPSLDNIKKKIDDANTKRMDQINRVKELLKDKSNVNKSFKLQEVKEMLKKQGERADGKFEWLLNSSKYFKDLFKSIKNCQEDDQVNLDEDKYIGEEDVLDSRTQIETDMELYGDGIDPKTAAEEVNDTTISMAQQNRILSYLLGAD